MPKISILEFITILIPEIYVFILGVYILVNQKFKARHIIPTGLILALITYLLKNLPIFPWANILFSILMISVSMVILSKMEIMKVVSSVLLLFMIRLVTEWLTMIVLVGALQLDLQELVANPIKKVLCFMPSVLLFALSIFILYLVKNKRKRAVLNESN